MLIRVIHVKTHMERLKNDLIPVGNNPDNVVEVFCQIIEEEGMEFCCVVRDIIAQLVTTLIRSGNIFK